MPRSPARAQGSPFAATYTPIEGSALSSAASVWNQPLAPGVLPAANSSLLVSKLNSEVAAKGANIQTAAYSTPIYVVGANQPVVTVWLWQQDAVLQSDLMRVPLPMDARPAPGTDGDLVIYQPSSDTMWELWITNRDGAGVWHAKWGARISPVSKSPGYVPAPYGASGSGLVEAGGVMTIQEQSEGVIHHALAIALPDIARSPVFPAQRSDGLLGSPDAIPEGTRFRLPPGLDIATLHLPRETEMMALAAQRYGIIVRDYASGGPTFYAQDPYEFAKQYGYDPYAANLFSGQWPRALLASFPWAALQVVTP